MAMGKRVTHFIPDHSDVWLLYHNSRVTVTLLSMVILIWLVFWSSLSYRSSSSYCTKIYYCHCYIYFSNSLSKQFVYTAYNNTWQLNSAHLIGWRSCDMSKAVQSSNTVHDPVQWLDTTASSKITNMLHDQCAESWIQCELIMNQNTFWVSMILELKGSSTIGLVSSRCSIDELAQKFSVACMQAWCRC